LITARDLRLFIQTSAVFILAITHVGTWNLAPSPGLYLLSVLNVSACVFGFFFKLEEDVNRFFFDLSDLLSQAPKKYFWIFFASGLNNRK
jgi:hypothetical protein